MNGPSQTYFTDRTLLDEPLIKNLTMEADARNIAKIFTEVVCRAQVEPFPAIEIFRRLLEALDISVSAGYSLDIAHEYANAQVTGLLDNASDTLPLTHYHRSSQGLKIWILRYHEISRRIAIKSLWQDYEQLVSQSIERTSVELARYRTCSARLHKTIYILGKRIADPGLPVVDNFLYLHEPQRHRPATDVCQLQQRTTHLADQFREAAHIVAISAKPTTGYEECAFIYSIIQQYLDEAVAGASPHLADLEAAVDTVSDYAQQLERLSRLIDSSDTSLELTLVRAYDLLDALTTQVEACYIEYHADLLVSRFRDINDTTTRNCKAHLNSYIPLHEDSPK